ncbi:hypothetical protein SETIT_9G009900v2 [Setaria italica]|uniref:Uncharacterized protein n=1 Tax=Setaria italica TaxID=4555 RepID=A0A368SC41_SETIT|nr:hypothetical protein SETIT_9G009900v2 [Setaria italica]
MVALCYHVNQVGEWILFYTAWSYRIEVWHLQAVDILAILILSELNWEMAMQCSANS